MIPRGRRVFREGDRLSVLGVPVAALDLPAAAALILRHARTATGPPMLVHPTGAHGLVEAARNPAFCDVLRRADVILPDGMPLVWVGRLAGFPGIGRVFGPDLMLEVCAGSLAAGTGHFLYGGLAGAAEALARALVARYPGLRICGIRTPPFGNPGAAELSAAAAAFRASGASILWIGASTPRQEGWAALLARELDAGVLITAGAAFDYNTGRIRRAPRWMQTAGLEWLARLAQDPARLAGRYARVVPTFAVLILRQALGGAPGGKRADR